MFRTYDDSRALALHPWNWNCHSIIRKSLDLTVGTHVFFKNEFIRT